MGYPVVQFEIGCRDVVRASDFYSSVFGWSVGHPQGTTAMINTGSEAGIPGALTALGHEPHRYINIYVEVDDIDHSVAEVKRHGGAVVVGPLPIPGESAFSHFAWVGDPDGNTVGLLQRKL